MDVDKKSYVAKIYHALCLIVTISLVLWCIHDYCLDRDVTEILLRAYHDTPDDIYPSITVCYKEPFLDQKFVNYDKNISKYFKNNLITTDYWALINGDRNHFEHLIERYWIGGEEKNEQIRRAKLEKLVQRLQIIDYDDVTINMKDIIAQFEVRQTINSRSLNTFEYNVVRNSELVLNKFVIVSSVSEQTISQPLKGFSFVNAYVSNRQSDVKCFTFDVPYERGIEIKDVRMRLNASIFDWKLSPSQTYFTLTYPHQLLRTSLGNRIHLSIKRSPLCYKFEVYVGSMEVFRRRDKTSARCNEDWRRHDVHHLENIIENVGCNPTHWKLKSRLPNCSTIDQYVKANKQMYQKSGYMPPCRSIEKLARVTKGTDLGLLCSFDSYPYLDLIFYFDEESLYKEIVLAPAYTFQSLIGNAGNHFLPF